MICNGLCSPIDFGVRAGLAKQTLAAAGAATEVVPVTVSVRPRLRGAAALLGVRVFAGEFARESRAGAPS